MILEIIHFCFSIPNSSALTSQISATDNSATGTTRRPKRTTTSYSTRPTIQTATTTAAATATTTISDYTGEFPQTSSKNQFFLAIEWATNCASSAKQPEGRPTASHSATATGRRSHDRPGQSVLLGTADYYPGGTTSDSHSTGNT